MGRMMGIQCTMRMHAHCMHPIPLSILPCTLAIAGVVIHKLQSHFNCRLPRADLENSDNDCDKEDFSEGMNVYISVYVYVCVHVWSLAGREMYRCIHFAYVHTK